MKQHTLYLIAALLLIAGGSAFIISVPEVETKAERYVPPTTSNVMSLSLNTLRQPSDQRNAIICYNVTISCAATLVLGAAGQIDLDTSATGISNWGVSLSRSILYRLRRSC